jgi:hypothetical protein
MRKLWLRGDDSVEFANAFVVIQRFEQNNGSVPPLPRMATVLFACGCPCRMSPDSALAGSPYSHFHHLRGQTICGLWNTVNLKHFPACVKDVADQSWHHADTAGWS